MSCSRIDAASYQELSEACAKHLLQCVREKPDARIILATGHSPRLSYRLFVHAVLEAQVDVRSVTWIKLDEWAGLPAEHPATCEYFLRQEILKPLDISQERYLAFDGVATDPAAECRRVELALEAMGGADLVILGVGRNGHLGLNEPGEKLSVGAHVATLDPLSQQHAMLAGTESIVTQGLTLGMGALFAAREALLLVTGAQKEPVAAQLRSGEVSTRCPATFLHLHQKATYILDQDSLLVMG